MAYQAKGGNGTIFEQGDRVFFEGRYGIVDEVDPSYSLGWRVQWDDGTFQNFTRKGEYYKGRGQSKLKLACNPEPQEELL